MLAGFGLSLSVVRSWRSFYLRRFVRVLVPYYLVVTVLYVVNLFRPYFPGDGLYAWAGNIFLFKMFDGRIFLSFGSVFWFVSVLVALYLVFPLLVWAQNRLGGVRFVLAASLVSAGYLATVAVLGLSDADVVRNFFLAYLWEFCLGMALGRAYRDDRVEFWSQPIWVLALVALGGLAAMALLALAGGSVGRLANDVPALFGYTALAALAYALARRVHPAVVATFGFLGAISYELYLVHIVVWRAITQDIVPNLSGTALIVESVLVVPVAVLVAAGLSALMRRLFAPRPAE
jgi:peptidoglycan/LPS O-acetylase OafA/YrhL